MCSSGDQPARSSPVPVSGQRRMWRYQLQASSCQLPAKCHGYSSSSSSWVMVGTVWCYKTIFPHCECPVSASARPVAKLALSCSCGWHNSRLSRPTWFQEFVISIRVLQFGHFDIDNIWRRHLTFAFSLLKALAKIFMLCGCSLLMTLLVSYSGGDIMFKHLF